jgi:hypothetical protein
MFPSTRAPAPVTDPRLLNDTADTLFPDEDTVNPDENVPPSQGFFGSWFSSSEPAPPPADEPVSHVTKFPTQGYTGNMYTEPGAEDPRLLDETLNEDNKPGFFGNMFIPNVPCAPPPGDDTLNQDKDVPTEGYFGNWFSSNEPIKDPQESLYINREENLYHTESTEGDYGVQFLLFGFFMAGLAVIVPIWDGIALLNDPVWHYMCGTSLPILLISISVVVPLFFLLVLCLLLSRGTGHTARQEQTLFSVAILFIMLLGALFVTMSTPIQNQAQLANLELMFQCKTGIRTQPLYNKYQQLQGIRNQSSCASKRSVDQCDGFSSGLNSSSVNYTDVLQGIEKRMQCSGFCFVPTVTNGTNATAASAGSASASGGYPLALFSKASMSGSCSAMAARDMNNFAYDVGTKLEWEGYFLMAASILQGFLIVTGSCVKNEVRKIKYGIEGGYGTI